jgi:DNA-binding HxlR family transcriptional regulator
MLRTKAQRQTLCSSCPIAKTANLVGDSFTLLLIRDLSSGPKRFKDFEKSLSGVSTRTLTNKLLILIEKGIVVRKEFQEKPPRVEYQLTESGKGLGPLLKAMEKYGTSFL